jgi:hypothetical protein
MKLAACITIMNGGDADFVLHQYRAMCCLDFDAMSKSAQALVRQVDSGKTRASDTREVLARGFRVFDKDRHGVSKIQISDADMDAAVELVRSVLRNSVCEEHKHVVEQDAKAKRQLAPPSTAVRPMPKINRVV